MSYLKECNVQPLGHGPDEPLVVGEHLPGVLALELAGFHRHLVDQRVSRLIELLESEVELKQLHPDGEVVADARGQRRVQEGVFFGGLDDKQRQSFIAIKKEHLYLMPTPAFMVSGTVGDLRRSQTPSTVSLARSLSWDSYSW